MTWVLVVSMVGMMAPDTSIGASELLAASGAWGSHLVGDHHGGGSQDVAS
jgi:hypothetical protein